MGELGATVDDACIYALHAISRADRVDIEVCVSQGFGDYLSNTPLAHHCVG